MKLLFSCLLAALWPLVSCLAQKPVAPKGEPLRIGEIIPQHLVITGVYNYHDTLFRFADHRDKLVVIDFWGRYCSPCIKALPKLDSLQQVFKDSLVIVAVSDFTNGSDLRKAMEKFPALKGLQLPLTTGNPHLSALFPHNRFSHVVWIAPGGKVKAFTGTDELIAINIREALSKDTLHWIMKRDAVDFDWRRSLLAFNQPGVEPPAPLYYSAFTGFIDGIAPPTGTTIDSARGVSYTAYYNYSLLDYCQMAVDNSTSAALSEFVLNVIDSSRFLSSPAADKNLWDKQNRFCYYLQLPLGIPAQAVRSYVQQDIRRWLELLGIRVEKQYQTAEGRQQARYIITEFH